MAQWNQLGQKLQQFTDSLDISDEDRATAEQAVANMTDDQLLDYIEQGVRQGFFGVHLLSKSNSDLDGE